MEIIMTVKKQYINSGTTKIIIYAVAAILICGMVWSFSIVLPPAVDWQGAFRPAALKLLAGRSPYEVEGFFNPFWALLPLIPMAIFPEPIGRTLLLIFSLLSFGYTGIKLGAKVPAIVLLLLSPPAVHGYLNGNIDSLVLLGLVLPHWIGLFFVTIKPQIGLAIALFWVFEAWRNGGWRQVFRLVWPLFTFFSLSILIFGFWPLRSAKEIDLWWNASFWPISIPVGLALLIAALRKRNINYAMGASPLLSPYILFHSWIIALFAIAKSIPELFISVVGLWILVIVRAYNLFN
jgi:hypothetical protein